MEDDLSVHRWIIILGKFQIRRRKMGSCNFKYSGFCLEFRQIGGCIWLEGGLWCWCCHSAPHAVYTDLSLLESTRMKSPPPPPQNGVVLRRYPWPEVMARRVLMCVPHHVGHHGKFFDSVLFEVLYYREGRWRGSECTIVGLIPSYFDRRSGEESGFYSLLSFLYWPPFFGRLSWNR